jgi:hypothetical protein
MTALEGRLPAKEMHFVSLMVKIMQNIPLGQHHLFFLIGTDTVIRLVRPMLPLHMLEHPNIDSTHQFKLYSEYANHDLLRSWDEVPPIDAQVKIKEVPRSPTPYYQKL